MASGMARGAAARGKRVAFGDRQRIIWGPWSAEVFRYNPNVARPGSERDPDIEWVEFYRGNRGYHLGSTGTHWIYNMAFRPVPGELYFHKREISDAERLGIDDCVMIEPNTPPNKSNCVNKQWPYARFQEVADRLRERGHRVVQLIYPSGRYRIEGAQYVPTKDFRSACAALSRAALFIGGEGGMHHAAAALDVPAVVIFGGYTPVELTGYPLHINLAPPGTVACGSLQLCHHCIEALEAISVNDVLDGASHLLARAA